MPATEIAAGVARVRFPISNAYLVDARGGGWVLIDSGTPGHERQIREAAEARYGAGARPAAILLTHGHFDHAGSSPELARLWDVPVYAHRMELPYLTGRSAYPPKDPTTGGFMGLLSRFLPSGTVKVGERLRELPFAEVPGLPEWTWHHTPGHAPGHVAFYHPGEATLLAGDAITTMDLHSFGASLVERRRICRPPAPFTYDWEAARESIAMLARLRPAAVGAGHGAPMSGPEVAEQLWSLARHLEVPEGGRYSVHAARVDQTGVVWLPPPVPDRLPVAAAGAGVALAAATAALLARRRRTAQRSPSASRSASSEEPALRG